MTRPYLARLALAVALALTLMTAPLGPAAPAQGQTESAAESLPPFGSLQRGPEAQGPAVAGGAQTLPLPISPSLDLQPAGPPAAPPPPGGPPPPPPPGGPLKAEVGYSIKSDRSPPLRSLKPAAAPAGPAIREIPHRLLPKAERASGVQAPKAPADRPAPDSVLQVQPAALNMPSSIVSFDGVPNVDGVVPPDPNGDVGPNHYVQWVNLSFQIWNKSGDPLYGPAPGNTLWTGFGGPCETENDGDVIALYDPLADRWLMSQFALPNGQQSGPYYQCIAISQTPDPTGAYYRYAFLVNNTKMNDYPKFGVWPDGYYMSVNQFTGNQWRGAGAYVFDRVSMLNGNPATFQYFDLFGVDADFGGMLPSDLDGSTPPPTGSPNYFAEVDDAAWIPPVDAMRVWEFRVDWANPANSTFGINGQPNATLAVAPFTLLPCVSVGSRDCIPQPGVSSSSFLDSLGDRLMYRLSYRNFGNRESMVVNHTVRADGADRAGVRWYEVRRSGGLWSIYQQGTHAPTDGLYRWMGSVAMDRDGNMALGYSVSSSAVFPSIRYTGRLATDPLGVMAQGETELIAGGGSQTDSRSRWGDYSSMSVDPADDCTFWYTQEYVATTGFVPWRTRIGSFKFPECAAPAAADLAVAKGDAPDPVLAGSPLTYTVSVSNNGPSAGSSVALTDTLPAGVTFASATSTQGSCTEAGGSVNCSLGGLTAGATATVTIVVTPTAAGTITNTATASAAEADPNPANNTATAGTTVQPAADLAVAKADSPDPVLVGSPLTYTVSVSNNGPSAGSSVALTDTLPAGVTFASVTSTQGSCSQAGGSVNCSLGALTAGATATVTIVVTPTAAGTINNTATASAAETDPAPANNTATVATTVQAAADLAVAKGDAPDPVLAGSPLTYTVSVSNNGPSAGSSVALTDTLPAGVTFASATSTQGSCSQAGGSVNCSLGALAAGATATVTIVVTPTAAGTINNTATASAAETDPAPANNTATVATTVQAAADLALAKADSPDPVLVGSPLTYTVGVSNNGPSAASSVALTDTLPAGVTFASASSSQGSCTQAGGVVNCSLGSLASGAAATATIVVTPTVAGTITNTATVSSSDPDPVLSNNTATAVTTVSPAADLSVTKVDTPDPVVAGGILTYTITLRNDGPSSAAGVSLSDTVPASTTFRSMSSISGWTCATPPVGGTGTVTCTTPSLPAAAVRVFRMTVVIDAGAAGGGTITNRADISSGTADPNLANNAAVATTTVALADLSVTKTDAPDPVAAGGILTYTITLRNNGPTVAASLRLTDTVPGNTTFRSLTRPPGWTCTTPAVGGTGDVVCTRSSLFSGVASVFTLSVVVDPGAPGGSSITNQAVASSATPDPNPANNSATTTTAVASADLSVTKVDTPDPVVAGGILTYTITLRNDGPSSAAAVSLSDTVPASTTFRSMSSISGWTCATPPVGGTGTVTCTTPSLPAAVVRVFRMTVVVDQGAAGGGTITNRAAISSGTADPNLANNAAVATTTVALADLSVTKTDAPDPVAAGGILTYTITLRNNGPTVAASLRLTDTVPGNTTFRSLTRPPGWTCTTPAVGGTGDVVCTRSSLFSGVASVFILSVVVDPGAPGGSSITNQAVASSATPDPNPSNNSATTTTTVSGVASAVTYNPWKPGETGVFVGPGSEHDAGPPLP